MKFLIVDKAVVDLLVDIVIGKGVVETSSNIKLSVSHVEVVGEVSRSRNLDTCETSDRA